MNTKVRKLIEVSDGEYSSQEDLSDNNIGDLADNNIGDLADNIDGSDCDFEEAKLVLKRTLHSGKAKKRRKID